MDNVNPMTLSHVVSGQLTCLTGMVTFEPESGWLVYDDTQVKTCDFGQTQCYQRTMFATVGNWPGNYEIYHMYNAIRC